MHTWFEPTRFGDTVVHTGAPTLPWEPVEYHAEAARAVRRHVERTLGPIDAVFVERRPDRVLVTLLHVARPDAHLLVTCGMSALPMTPPDDADHPPHAELVLGLPRSWPMATGRFAGPHAWPVDLLTDLARLPHKTRSFFGPGHTIVNGRPPEPFAPSTAFCGALLRPPDTLPAVFRHLDRPDGARVEFLGVVPLLADEFRLAGRLGSLVLLDRLDAHDVGLVLDPARSAVTRRPID